MNQRIWCGVRSDSRLDLLERAVAGLEKCEPGAKIAEIAAACGVVFEDGESGRKLRSAFRSAVRTARGAGSFDIVLEREGFRMPVAEFVTNKGFAAACKYAMSRFRGTIGDLQCGGWFLVDAKNPKSRLSVEDVRSLSV